MPRVSPWWTGELGQSHAINDLDDELEHERAARLRQSRRLEAVQSDLKGGLDRVDSRLGSVADRIETVLSWTELRFQLLEFDEYEARKEIRKTVRALAQGRAAALPDTGDVPGYWLPPAAAAALPLVLRGRAGAPRAVPFTDPASGQASARERDAVRAELFDLAVGRCFDQPALVDAAVLRLLGGPVDLGTASGEVAAGWRLLWEHAALGEFGPAAADQLWTRLSGHFDADALDPAELAAWDAAAASFGAGDSPAAAYAALADHLAAARETAPGTRETSSPPLGGHAASEGAPEGTAPDGAAADDRPWRVLLQELIDEPSPAEMPLVREMEALELGGGPSRTSPSWTVPAGTVAALLRRDLFDPDAPVPLRRIALDLAGPLLRSRLATAPPAEDPAVVTVNRRAVAVAVTAEGPDPAKAAEIEARLNRSVEDPPSKALPGAVAAVLGALAVTLALAGQWFAAVVFAALAVVPFLWHRARMRERGLTVRDRDDKLDELHRALQHARDEAASRDARAAERRAAEDEARARLLAALP